MINKSELHDLEMALCRTPEASRRIIFFTYIVFLISFFIYFFDSLDAYSLPYNLIRAS
jgi:hypothetical protein